MRKPLLAALGAAALVLTGLVIAAPPASADVSCSNFSSNAGQCVNTQLTVGGTSYNVDWYVPNASAVGLMLAEHGFSRGCGNLRNTSKALMEKGLMVLCLNADMSGGNPTLGNALGDLLTSRAVTPPLGKPLPVSYVVGGHSAGGHFASVVGARLATNGYAGLRGAVMLDPVASGGFTENLQAISANGSRPVLSVAARPSLANLTNNSFGALQALNNSFVGIQLVWNGFGIFGPYGGSCHTDAEGANGDFIGNIAAGCSPSSTQTGRLRDFSSTWARDLAVGTQTPAYSCADEDVISTCGSRIRDLVDRRLPIAATIDAS